MIVQYWEKIWQGKASDLSWNNFFLFQHCTGETFTILAELRKCGVTDTETCLKSVTLNMNKGQTVRAQRKQGKGLLKPWGAKKLGLSRSRTAFLSQVVSSFDKHTVFVIKCTEIDSASKIGSATNLALWMFIKKSIVAHKAEKGNFLCQLDEGGGIKRAFRLGTTTVRDVIHHKDVFRETQMM